MLFSQRFGSLSCSVILVALFVCGGAFCPNSYAQSAQEKRVEEQLKILETGRASEADDAADRLLMVEPSSVNKDLRKRIARAFRSKVTKSHFGPSKEAVQGLVHWAGKYSTPVLIEVIEKASLGVDQSVYDALVDSEDPEAAAVLARQMGNMFRGEAAIKALKQMGSVAEPAIISIVKYGDEGQSLKAIALLGEIGTDKGLKELKRLTKRGPREIRGAAQVASIRLESRLGASSVTASAPGVDNDDPFAESTPSSQAASGLGSHPPEGDWSQVHRPLPEEADAGSFVPNPLPEGTKFPRKSKPTRLAQYPGGIHGRTAGVMVALHKPERLAVLTIDPFEKTPAMIQLVDIARGRALNPVPLSADTVLADISPDGCRVVAIAEEGSSARIDVYELNAKSTKLIDSWQPYAKSRGLSGAMFSTDMQWVRWISNEQFITLNQAGQMVVWDAVGAVARLQFDVDGWRMPALSPGGGQVAAVTEEGIVVFDTTNGETLFWTPEKSNRGSALGFDPAGTHLALAGGTRVQIWDLTTGTLDTDFNVKEMASPSREASGAVSLDGNRLIVRGSRSIDVIDLAQRRVLHRFTHNYNCIEHGSQTLAREASHSTSALYPCKLKVEEPKANDVPDLDSMLAIKPGAEVSFDVRVGGRLDTEIREYLTQAAEEAGLVVTPNAEMRFVARKETKSKEVNYRVFGASNYHNFGRPRLIGNDDNSEKKVNVKENIYTVVLHIDGEPAWTYRNHQGGSMHLRREEGESMQQASDRVTKASAGYFRGIEFPRYLVHPSHAGPLTTTPLRGQR